MPPTGGRLGDVGPFDLTLLGCCCVKAFGCPDPGVLPGRMCVFVSSKNSHKRKSDHQTVTNLSVSDQFAFASAIICAARRLGLLVGSFDVQNS